MSSNSFNQFSFELQPSEGIGFIKLGLSLYQIMNLLRSNDLNNDIRFIYSTNSKTIVLQLTKFNINLIFDSNFQKLILIEINLQKQLYNIKYIYKNETISNFEFKSIYNKIFGPTYPGFLNGTDYYLSYQGIAFKFNNVNLNTTKKRINDEDLIRVLSNSKDELNCSAITIFRGKSWEDSSNSIRQMLCTYKLDIHEKFDKLIDYDNNKLLQSSIFKVIIMFCEVNLPLKLITFEFKKHHLKIDKFTVQLDLTSMQEIIQIFGPPEDTLIKLDETNSNSNNNHSFFKIHNYFKFGFDVIYKLDKYNNNGCNIVNKIVVHSNIPNSLEFLKYERLNFYINTYSEGSNEFNAYNYQIRTTPSAKSSSITTPYSLKKYVKKKTAYLSSISYDVILGNESQLINNESIFKDFKKLLNTTTTSNQNNKPIFLNRKEYELNPSNINSKNMFELIDYEDDFSIGSGSGSSSTGIGISNGAEVVDEDRDGVSGDEDDDTDEFKNWGLSKLIGYGRCIFEILIDGDKISSITLL